MRPVVVVQVRAEPGVDLIRALRQWLKAGLRKFGLRCIYIAEQTREHQTNNKAAALQQQTFEQTAEETDMSNLPSIPSDDGWNDAAREAGGTMIKGSLLKFADWQWRQGKEGSPVPIGTQLAAVGTVAAWIKWQDGRPVEYRLRQPGQNLPERDELGDDDEAEWEAGPDGSPADPWRNTRNVFLIDPKTAEAFTFSTSSFGGRRAVSDLGDQIARMRTAYPDATPLVELQATEMPTRYGRKSRPVFKIVGWKTASGEAPVERQITTQDAEKVISDREIDDSIPF